MPETCARMGGVTMSEQTANYYSADSFDALANIFEPDVMLPSQFNAPDDEGVGGGERRLMAAILSDGIEAYIHQSLSRIAGNARGRFDACDWIEAPDPGYVFSFDNVCECLGINPEYLRLGLLRYVDAVHQHQMTGGRIQSAWKKIRRPRKQ